MPAYKAMGPPRVGGLEACKCAAHPRSAAEVTKVIRARRMRDQFLGQSLFSDPAWDILLEAYVAHLAGRAISSTSLCAAAAVPPTTGLRWLRKLEQDQLIIREADPSDRRRTWMRLSAGGSAAMERYFDAVGNAQPI